MVVVEVEGGIPMPQKFPYLEHLLLHQQQNMGHIQMVVVAVAVVVPLPTAIATAQDLVVAVVLL